MKIPANKIDSFVTRPDKNILGALIYGSDYGLNSLRANSLHKAIIDNPKDVFRNLEISYKDIKKDPAKLNDNLKAKSLFPGRRFIKITDCEASITKPLSEIIKSYTGNSFIILMAEDLSPTSSLRKLFESQNNLASIACYKDDISSTKQIILQFFKENSYIPASGVVDSIAHHFSGNRLLVLSELNKLITYKGSDKNINLNDVALCINDNVEMSLESLSHAFASANFNELENSLQRSLEENTSAITIIRTLMYYFNKLYTVRCKIDNGVSTDQAVSSLKPPIFFKNVPIFKSHLNIWNQEKIITLLTALQNLELQCKNSKLPSETLLKNFLFLMANKLKAK